MKTIDWTKPLQWTKEWQGSSDKELNLRVVEHSKYEAVVAWGKRPDTQDYAVVDNEGRRDGAAFVENVPEEPADTICLYRDGEKWRINTAGIRGNPWDQKQVAPRSYWGNLPGYVFVKVPV